MMLEWRKSNAYWRGRLVFAIIKEKTGWKLYRYSERNGIQVFKSKEAVRSKADGRAYAEGLYKLWPDSIKN